MNERDVVFFPLGPKHLPHPGVVVRIEDDQMIIVCGGTGTARDLPHIVVQANSRDARALKLYKDTYFYESNVVALRPGSARQTTMRCPPELFWKLKAMANEVIARVGLKQLRGDL